MSEDDPQVAMLKSLLAEARSERDLLRALADDLADVLNAAGYGKVWVSPTDFEGWGGTIGPTDDDPCPCETEEGVKDCVCCDPVSVSRRVVEFLVERWEDQ